MKIPPKNEIAVLAFIVVGVALAAVLTVESLISPAAAPGPSEAERKAAFEAALEKGNLSLEDALHWRVLEPGSD